MKNACITMTTNECLHPNTERPLTYASGYWRTVNNAG